MEYKYVELADYVDVIGGYAFKSKMFTNEGIPVLKIKNVQQGKVDLADTQYISNDLYDNSLEKYLVKNKDILIAMTGQGSVGRVGRVYKDNNDKFLLNQRVGNIIVKDNKFLDSNYLFYILSSRKYEEILFNAASGSGQPNLSPSIIKSIKIPWIEVSKQRFIGELLDLLDSKIRNNTNIIFSLECIANEVFKRWFIDFEFPNEQDLPYQSSGGEMVESELGEIPFGWNVGKIGDISFLSSEKVNLDKNEEKMNYIGLEHMPQGSIALNEWESSEKVSGIKAKFNREDILFGKLRPYFKKVGVAPIDGVCSTDILVIRSKNLIEYGFLICQLTQDKFIEYTTSTATGTRMPRSGWNQISNYKIVIPTNEVLENFNQMILSMLKITQEKILENNYLENLRDSLLPKFLSGEIEIPDESVVERL